VGKGGEKRRNFCFRVSEAFSNDLGDRRGERWVSSIRTAGVGAGFLSPLGLKEAWGEKTLGGNTKSFGVGNIEKKEMV